MKKRIYLPTTKDAHSGLPAGFLPDGVGIVPSHRKKPMFKCSVSCSRDLLSRETQWQTLKDEDHIFRITGIKYKIWADLEIKVAPRYGDSGLAQNVYSAQTFIYLR